MNPRHRSGNFSLFTGLCGNFRTGRCPLDPMWDCADSLQKLHIHPFAVLMARPSGISGKGE
jgi:hypothetical protein